MAGMAAGLASWSLFEDVDARVCVDALLCVDSVGPNDGRREDDAGVWGKHHVRARTVSGQMSIG